MSSLLINHQDFMSLIYGLTFFVLALSVVSMSKRWGRAFAWRFFSAFAFIHGLNEWLDMLVPTFGDPYWFSVSRVIILGAAFICLFEFGRRSVVWVGDRKAGAWIYFPSLLIILYGVYLSPADFEALVRYNLGFPAGLLAALALWQNSLTRKDIPQRWPDRAGPVALCLYAVASGLITSDASFWPANHLSPQNFEEWTGIPVQLLRALLAGIVTISIWRNYVHWRVRAYPAEFNRRISTVRLVTSLVGSIIMVGGWILVERAGAQCREEHERHLLSLTKGMAAIMSAKQVQELSQFNADLRPVPTIPLRLQCQRISESDPDIRYVYLMVKRGENIVFLLDVEPQRCNMEVDKPNASMGEIYENPPHEIRRVFNNGVAVVSKPYSDAWGMFISGFAPIVDAGGVIVGVLGIDQRASHWVSDIAYARLLRLLFTGGGIVLILIFAALWRRAIEESQIRNTNGQRMQAQQSALLRITNSAFLVDGNVFMMARAVTSATAEVIEVERVALWLKAAGLRDFRAEDIYNVRKATHSSGHCVTVADNDPFLKVLEEGRVAASFDFLADERFNSIRNEIGPDARAMLVAPLRVSGRLAGWLTAIQTSRCRKWLTDEMRFLAEMADQVAHALINNERRMAEDALRKAHNELEMRVRERTEALSLKNDELLREINERLRIEEEQRSLEDKMLQAQKLESLGLMAGGIAHDFNNILMAVLGNVELARLEVSEDSPIYEYLCDIDKASCRAAELARQMLIYSGRGHASIQGVNLNELVVDMTSMLKVSLGKKIQLTYELEQGIPLVDGDLTQLRQVLMNLVINASEAIGKESGAIILRTGTIHYDEAMLETMWLKDDLPAGKYVFMDVVDTGCGMDEDTLKRIFDPFFTTKFTGRGLGLAAVLGIIKGHHGTIDVSSKAGSGTQFRVILPIGCRSLSGKMGAVPSVEKLAWKGEGLILLADDEESVRTLGCRMLEHIGFTVLAAKDGREAIQKFKEHCADIRCVLLDLTMPDLDGKETLDEIRSMEPSVKVILCSGYMEDNMMGNLADWKVSGFLQKPYKLEALLELLRNTLSV